MITKPRRPETLVEIARIMAPEVRAKALLEFGTIDPYNEVHVSLVHSVDTPKAGEAGRLLQELWDDLCCSPEYISYQEAHFFDLTSFSADDPDPSLTCHSDDEIERLAEALLKCGRWKRSEQSPYVYLASCFGCGPNSYHLRALALIDGIIVFKRIEAAYN